MSVTPATTTVDSALSASAGASPAASLAPPISLRLRALYGSGWTTVAYGVTQVFRLISNLILTRILLPDEFGLSTMVAVFLQGLQMFSDIGTGPAIIHARRGGEADFQNTAWTMAVIRGFVLWICACIGAWPMAMFFGQPRLTLLIIVSGFASVIMGFNSTAAVFLNRQLQLGKVTILEIVGQVVHLVANIVFCLWLKNVWGLVLGGFVGVIFRTIVSHFLVPGHRNRFRWNVEDARMMYGFGKWIFIGTALTFFASQTDRLLMGNMLGAGSLALYSIAVHFAVMPTVFIKKIGAQVVFPMLSEISRERPEQLYSRLRMIRVALIGLSLLFLLPLILGGELLINALYPHEYHYAGVMLQVLSAGAILGAVISTYGAALLAIGKTFPGTFLLVTELILLIAAAKVGYHWKGEQGFVIGIASIQWLNYPFWAWVMARQKLWQPEVDMPAMLVSVLAIIFAFFWI